MLLRIGIVLIALGVVGGIVGGLIWGFDGPDWDREVEYQVVNESGEPTGDNITVIREDDRARETMDRLLRVASPLGLYAEEFDAGSAHHLGNFPQAFSHLALIEAAARLIVRERLDEFS